MQFKTNQMHFQYNYLNLCQANVLKGTSFLKTSLIKQLQVIEIKTRNKGFLFQRLRLIL